MEAHMRTEYCEKVACGRDRPRLAGRVVFLDDRLVVLEGVHLGEIVVADAFANAGPRLSEVHVPRSYIAITIAYSWSCPLGSGLQLQAMCLLARNRMQQFHQIDCGTGLGCGGGVEEFATAVPTDGNYPAMGAVYNEVTDLRKVHAASRVESVNRKGVIALLFA